MSLGTDSYLLDLWINTFPLNVFIQLQSSKGFLNLYHYYYRTLEIYYYYSRYCKGAIIILQFLQIHHYLPIRYIFQNLWTKIPFIFFISSSPHLFHGRARWKSSVHACLHGGKAQAQGALPPHGSRARWSRGAQTTRAMFHGRIHGCLAAATFRSMQIDTASVATAQAHARTGVQPAPRAHARMWIYRAVDVRHHAGGQAADMVAWSSF